MKGKLEQIVFIIIPYIFISIEVMFLTTWLLTKVEPLFWEKSIMIFSPFIILGFIWEQIKEIGGKE